MPVDEAGKAGFEIESVQTHATFSDGGDKEVIYQWAIITLCVPKDFDWTKRGAAVLRKLQAAADLIGRGE